MDHGFPLNLLQLIIFSTVTRMTPLTLTLLETIIEIANLIMQKCVMNNGFS